MSEQNKDSLKLRGEINIKVVDKDGNLKEDKTIKNTITYAGLAVVAGLINNSDSQNPFTYLAVGTGTTAASTGDTSLEAEITDTGLARASATCSRVTTNQTNDTSQLVKSWTATGVKAITECGILNAAADGTILGRQVFSAINTASGDIVSITYKVIAS